MQNKSDLRRPLSNAGRHAMELGVRERPETCSKTVVELCDEGLVVAAPAAFMSPTCARCGTHLGLHALGLPAREAACPETLPASSKWGKARETVFEMMADRGYAEAKGADPNGLVFEPTGEGGGWARGRRPLAVFFEKAPKVGINNIQEYATRLEEAQLSRCLLVVTEPISHSARCAVRNYRSQGIVFELFRLGELQHNVTHHVDVPPHRACTQAEADRVLKLFGIKSRDKFDKEPLILSSDPVMRYYGAARGTLVEITREMHTMPGHSEIAYRLVS